MKLFKRIFDVGRVFFSMFWMLPSYMKYLFAKDKNDPKIVEYVYRKVRKWASKRIEVTGSNITIVGIENIPERNVVFIGNHSGNFDVPLLLANIPKPVGFISKIELAHIPLLNLWMRAIRCKFIDRSDVRQSLKIMLEAIEEVKNGYSYVIFPEGTRSKSNKVAEFKPGAFKLATKGGVPIVPITLINSYKMFDENGYYVKSDVTVIFHEAILPESFDKELATRVKQIIVKPLEELDLKN